MTELEQEIDAVAAETGFSGVVRVDRGGHDRAGQAYGLAHRGYEIPNTIETRFATASATKGLTALVVVSLIEAGSLELSTTARSVLGDDLPLIADDVTVEHLLAHRSGIGDYLDEDADMDLADYLLPVPVHELVETEDYLAVLGGFPTKFPRRRAVLLLQRRLRRARPDRRAGEWRPATTTWCAAVSASPPGCATPSSCAPTSSPDAPRWAISR